MLLVYLRIPNLASYLPGLESRCLYNALNDRIRNLLLSYDYSKSADPLQPLASHLTSLLTREHPSTADIAITSSTESFRLHKFVLCARSPYFCKRLKRAPETATWRLPATIPPQAFGIAIRYLYLGELPRDFGGGPGTGFTDSEIVAATDRISKHLEIPSPLSLILESGDRRLARQSRTDEMEKGRDQLEDWFRQNVLQHAVETDVEKADKVKWDKDNAIFADVLLRADEDEPDPSAIEIQEETVSQTSALGIPLGSQDQQSHPISRLSSPRRTPRRSKIFPCHRAMLIRSEFFLTMFSSSFLEAQDSPHLRIISIACSPAVLEIVLTFIYTERATFPLSISVDVLFAADLLLLEKLKMRAAIVISTLGSGPISTTTTTTTTSDNDVPLEADREPESIDVYEILHAAWLTRVQRLEEFAARYIAYRLESYIDDPIFAELVRESADRITARQETDSIELLDDIRWYLTERFRTKFEDTGLDVMMEDQTDDQPPDHLPTVHHQLNNENSDNDHNNDDENDTHHPQPQPLPIPHWGSAPKPTTSPPPTTQPTDSQTQSQSQHQLLLEKSTGSSRG